MKSILSLILPGNSDQSPSRRFLKGGRKAYAFSHGQPVILGDDDSERGIQGLISTDAKTDSTATVSLNKRVNYLTHTAAAVEAALPPVAGELRDVTVIKNGANAVNVNINSGDTGNICLTATAAATTKFVVATATAGRFLSDGTNWYRISA
jgi:hypothetical protein